MHSDHDTPEKPFGLMAEFDSPESIVDAAQKTYDAGYRKIEAYSPFPVHGLDEAVGFPSNRVSLMVLICGLTGASTGFLLQAVSMAYHYPYMIGGRPEMSWPMFIPITFECGILFAAFSAVFGMFAMNGLPMPYHPVFNVKEFTERVGRDGFFLTVESSDDRYDADETRKFLEGLGAKNVCVVEP
ncbi:MAG TPA: DUF3341 domain-containing protein [Candidatus Hydrogenedentes bacterium]|nr:DUF3341 domain-containing protein [Candidatus Hydrogenedentota bacterium]